MATTSVFKTFSIARLWAILLTVALIGLNRSAMQAQVNQGLQIYYPLNGNALDSSGLSNNGSATDLIFTADRFNRPNGAGQFNGITSLITSSFPVNITRDFALTAWLKVTAFPTGPQLNSLFGIEESDLYLNAGLSGDSIGFRFKCGGTYQPQIARNMAANLDRWAHLAIVRKGTSQRLYLNGVLVDTAIACNDVPDGVSNTFYVGGSPLIKLFGFIGFYSGLMDEFRVYNRSLNQAEIDTLSGNVRVGLKLVTLPRASIVRIAANQIDIEGPQAIRDITLYNLAGQILSTQRIGSKRASLVAYTPGPILLRIFYVDGCEERRKI